MHIGMLWFDNDPATALKTKIEKAANYYRKKYGREPNLCLMHPSMFEAGAQRPELNSMTIRAYRPVLPGHLWIGIEDRG
jgi:hypothetical protein